MIGITGSLIRISPAHAQSDSDPFDPAGGGRNSSGLTDNDANDRAGFGNRGRSELTDNDANDQAGFGNRGRSGITDSDANDQAGFGRGGR